MNLMKVEQRTEPQLTFFIYLSPVIYINLHEIRRYIRVKKYRRLIDE